MLRFCTICVTWEFTIVKKTDASYARETLMVSLLASDAHIIITHTVSPEFENSEQTWVIDDTEPEAVSRPAFLAEQSRIRHLLESARRNVFGEM